MFSSMGLSTVPPASSVSSSARAPRRAGERAARARDRSSWCRSSKARKLVAALRGTQSDRPGVVDGLRRRRGSRCNRRGCSSMQRGLPDRLDEAAHLGLGEAEVGRQLGAEDAEDGDVVEAREQALLRDAQDAREHALEEVDVVLEAAGEEVAEERDHLVVVARSCSRRGWGCRTRRGGCTTLSPWCWARSAREEAQGAGELGPSSRAPLADGREELGVRGVELPVGQSR